jgi:hypothetical protein
MNIDPNWQINLKNYINELRTEIRAKNAERNAASLTEPTYKPSYGERMRLEYVWEGEQIPKCLDIWNNRKDNLI